MGAAKGAVAVVSVVGVDHIFSVPVLDSFPISMISSRKIPRHVHHFDGPILPDRMVFGVTTKHLGQVVLAE